MTTKLIPTPIESKEYDFVLITGLMKEESKLRKAIREVLDAIRSPGVSNLFWIEEQLSNAIKKD